MENLAKQAVQAIEAYKSNKCIMDFVMREALEKTAADIREKTKSGTTAKAVEILMIRNEEVKNRVQEYVLSGLIGCYMASIQRSA